VNKLLEIPKPKDKNHIIWEHVLTSCVGFVGTFVLMYFGPLFLASSGRHSYRRNGPNETIGSFYETMLENPEYMVLIASLVTIGINLFILRKNRKMKLIVGIIETNFDFQIERTNAYFAKVEKLSVPKERFSFRIERMVSSESDKKQELIFSDSQTRMEIGRIKPQHIFWEKQITQVRNVIQNLKQYREPDTQRRSGFNPVSFLFDVSR
jgi:hypothetical protein